MNYKTGTEASSDDVCHIPNQYFRKPQYWGKGRAPAGVTYATGCNSDDTQGLRYLLAPRGGVSPHPPPGQHWHTVLCLGEHPPAMKSMGGKDVLR